MQRAKPFIATRHHHLEETAEDYTELIDELIKSEGEARTCTLARHLGVSHVTALKTLKRLQKEGYITTERHKPILLTEKGSQLAKYAKEKHQIVLEFLISMGIPHDIASIDAEGMEHHISPETLAAFKKNARPC